MTTRVQDYGGISGDVFDDGVNDYVRKVIVGEDSHGIAYIKIEYVKDGVVVQREHGNNTGTQTEVFTFVLLFIILFLSLSALLIKLLCL